MSQVIDEKNTNPETPFILKDYMSDEYVPCLYRLLPVLEKLLQSQE